MITELGWGVAGYALAVLWLYRILWYVWHLGYTEVFSLVGDGVVGVAALKFANPTIPPIAPAPELAARFIGDAGNIC